MVTFWNKWLAAFRGPTRTIVRPRPARARLEMESLEDRTVPALFLDGAGVLHLEGGLSADVAEVTVSGGQMVAKLNLQSATFDPGQVKSILFLGSDGNDTFYNFTHKHAVAYGGRGDDYLSGDEATDGIAPDGINRFFGEGGHDTLYGGSGTDLLSGGTENDLISAGSNTDHLYGGAGDDVLSGDSGNDWLYGEAGNDIASGNSGNDRVHGGDGDDYLSGEVGNDILFGDAGNDRLFGDDGADVLYGGIGNDWMEGGTGDDRLDGGDGTDILSGSPGDDILFGGKGRDFLYGSDGDDYLNGGEETAPEDGELDHLYGNAGSDTFKVVGVMYDIVADYQFFLDQKV